MTGVASVLPPRSFADAETLAVYCVPAARSASGLNRSTPGPYQPKLPLTGAPSLVRFSEKAAWAEALSIALLKSTVVSALRETLVAPPAGETLLMTGGVVVVNCQVFAA